MKKLPILVIDDEEPVRSALCEVLDPEFATSQAAGTREALALLKGRPFSFVLLDLLLADGSGKDLLRSIKSAWPLTEVILVTGTNDVGTVLECLEEGAYDYLNKPWDLQDLRAVARRAAEKWALATLLCATEADQEGLGNPSPRTLAAEYLQSRRIPYSPAYQERIRRAAQAGPSLPFHQIVEDLEKTLILDALKASRSNRTLAAQLLGLHRNSLNLKIKLLNIQVPPKRSQGRPAAPGPGTALA